MNLQLTRRELVCLSAASGGLAIFKNTAFGSEPVPEKNKSLSKLETVLHTDVLVIGAGSSGIPAAIAAAREGAKVILIEEDLLPGGAPVDMNVAMLCGGPRVGIYREMIHHLNSRYDLSGKPDAAFGDTGEDGRNHWYLPASYLSVLTEMIGAEKNITLMCGARPVEIIVSPKSVSSRLQVEGALVAHGLENLTRIYARITIDATGTAEVAAKAGCKTIYGREARSDYGEPFGAEKADNLVQRCTWMYISQRIRPDAVFDPAKLKNRSMVEDKIDHWVGKDPETPKRNAGIYLHWGATVQCSDTRDTAAIAKAQREAMDILKPDFLTLLKNGFAVHLAPKIGVRECRRVLGEYVVTVNDLKSGKFPDDVIALSDYGLDPWGENLTKEQIECPRFGVPYRALIPKDTDGLLVVGKSISGTHLAASSYRVQPIVASIGQAAGIAASIAVRLKTNLRSIPISQLLDKLYKAGVLIKSL